LFSFQEGTFLHREEIGQDLPYKTIMEDIFIRKFMHGTWPEAFASMVIIKRHHNIIRIAGIINRSIMVRYHLPTNNLKEELIQYLLNSVLISIRR
jgi:small subunit ribosomal protein S24